MKEKKKKVLVAWSDEFRDLGEREFLKKLAIKAKGFFAGRRGARIIVLDEAGPIKWPGINEVEKLLKVYDLRVGVSFSPLRVTGREEIKFPKGGNYFNMLRADYWASVNTLKMWVQFKRGPIFVISPCTARYFTLIESHIKRTKHSAFNNYGGMKDNADWTLNDALDTELSQRLALLSGYAGHFPGVPGNGADIVKSCTIEYKNFNDVRERVGRAIELAGCEYRHELCYFEEDKISNKDKKYDTVRVRTEHFGWFHLGTLIAYISRKYPDVDHVIVESNSDTWPKHELAVAYIGQIDENSYLTRQHHGTEPFFQRRVWDKYGVGVDFINERFALVCK